MFWLAFLALSAATNGRLAGLPRDAANTTGTLEGPAVIASSGFNLSSYCDAQRTSYFNTYNPTGSYTTSTITDYQGFFGTGSQSTEVVTQTYSTRTITFTEENYMAYQLGGAKPPCCSTCRMHAGTIQFYWWPGLASATATSSSTGTGPVTSVGSNGFIFTSPSVYMAFSSIYAKNFCGTVGDIWYNTTIGFHPDDISTINPYTVTYSSFYTTTYQGSVETVQAAESGTLPPPSRLKYTDLAQNCSTISGYHYFPNDPQNDIDGGFEQDLCHPLLDIPQALIDMQSAWKDNDCQAGEFEGAYDPPVALTQVDEEAQPTLPGGAQPGSVSTPTSAPMTGSYTALPENHITGTQSWTLSTGTAAAITIGSDVIGANSIGAYVLDPDNTLSVGGASYGVDGTAYALETDSSGHTVLVAVATSTDAGETTVEPGSTVSGSTTQSGNSASATSTTSEASRYGMSAAVLILLGITISLL